MTAVHGFPYESAPSLAAFETAAEQVLGPEAWAYYRSGACDERTLADNIQAFGRRRLLPHVLTGTAERQLCTTALGAELAMPVLVAPTAMHRLADPEGEVATTRAAAAAGTVMTLSTFSTRSVEDVCAAARQADPAAAVWFQLYPLRDRGATREMVQRALSAGVRAIVLTADMPMVGKRESEIALPLRLPRGVRFEHVPGMDVDADVGALHHIQEWIDPTFAWSDLERLCGDCPVPVAVKGVLRADDARRAVGVGARAVIVSNHGGRQLDGAVAALDALPAVAEAVGTSAEVLMDGGVRRGSDVLVALALGARAVLVGRPVLWGLAAGGEAGVRTVLRILADELDLAMALAGCSSIAGVRADLLATSPR